MEINKVLNVMALYFLPFQIYAKEEITFPIIKETNSTNSGFFYDSFVSSFNYIFNFSRFCSLYKVLDGPALHGF